MEPEKYNKLVKIAKRTDHRYREQASKPPRGEGKRKGHTGVGSEIGGTDYQI